MSKEENRLAAAEAENAAELSLSSFAAAAATAEEDAQKSEPLDIERHILQIMAKNHGRNRNYGWLVTELEKLW